MKIGIFCSANKNIEPLYFEKTRELGQWIAQNGHTIVFGGCNLGLMECIAESVHEAGGQTVGVVPSIIEKNGRLSDHVDIHIPCDNLSDRKDLFLCQSDVLVALPGGIGHNKKVILYNINGFWNSLIAMLDDMDRHGMIRGQWHDYIQVADSLEMLTALL